METLLRKWDSSREIQRDEIYRALSFKRKVQLLMSIAKPTFEKGELFFRQRDLEQRIVAYLAKLPGALSADIIDGTIILKAIESQHSILVERAQGIYSFSHLTLQEYLTARYLAENQGGGLYRTLIRHHLADQRWREVFLLTATLLDDANEFVAVLRSLIDGLVTDSPVLRQLLTWADGRTQRIEAPVERRFTVQLAYIFLALAHTRALDLALARDLDLALEIASVSNLAPALALASDLARSLYSATAFDLDLARSFDRSLDLARSTTELVGFDYGLYYSWGYATLLANSALDRNAKNWQTTMQQFPNLVQGIAVLAHKAGLVSLMQALEAQPIPLPTAGTQDWQHYADLLLVMLRDQRGLGQEWNFSAHDEEKLNYYFYFNELLVQCLKVAAVTDRQAVLNSLLLPPPASKDQASATHG